MLEIQVVGPGCRNCQELEARVKKILLDMGVEFSVKKVSDYMEIAKSGILMTPGLIVDGKILSQGKLPTEATLRHWLLQAVPQQQGAGR